MDNKNIIFNRTLEQYNKKYKNRNYRLVRLTKKQVEEFDRLHKTSNNYLLKDRKWWLIKDTYYEVPKAPRFTWFRNLNAGIQTGVCVLGAGVVATAVTVPLVLMNQNKEDTGDKIPDIEISESIKSSVEIKDKKFVGDNLEMTLSIKDEKKEFTGNIKVTIGNTVLKEKEEFNFVKDTGKLSIKKSIIETNKGASIIIEPELKDKTPETESIKLNKTKLDLGVGRTYQLVAAVDPKEAEVTFESSNPSIISVSTDGLVTANKATNDGEKITITAKSGNKTATCEVTSFIFYQIDWVTTKVTLDDTVGSNYLFEYARKSNVIEFIKDDDTQSGIFVGEDNVSTNPVYASYTGDEGEKTLRIWSKGKISFNNEDNPYNKFPEEYEYECFGLFGGCDQLESINFNNIETNEMTEMKHMFRGVANVENLDLKTFDTSNVKTMESMFRYDDVEEDIALKSIDLTSFDTSKVTDMSGMFWGSHSLLELDLSSFNTSNVTTMKEMFSHCSSLKKIDVSSFDTSKVKNFDETFFNLGNIDVLDVSSFSSESAESAKSMFACDDEFTASSLKTIYATDKFNLNSVPSEDCFKYCIKLIGGKDTIWDENHIDGEYARLDDPENNKPGYFTDAVEKPYNIDWCSTKFFNDKTLFRLCQPAINQGVEIYHGAEGIEFIQDSGDIKEGEVCVGENADKDKIYASWDESSYKLVLRAKNKIAFSDNDNYDEYNGLFSGYFNLQSIDLSNVDTKQMTSMAYMFSMCNNIEKLDVSTFDTSNVTNMEGMFLLEGVNYEPSKLQYLNGLASFDTSKTKIMDYMFYAVGCTSLDISSFDTSNVIDMSGMFCKCPNLEKIFASEKFVTTQVTSSEDMFAGSEKIVGGNGTKVSVIKVYDNTYAKIDKEGQEGYFTAVKELIYNNPSMGEYDGYCYIEDENDVKADLYTFEITVTDSHPIKNFYITTLDWDPVSIDNNCFGVYVNGNRINKNVTVENNVLNFPVVSNNGDKVKIVVKINESVPKSTGTVFFADTIL